MYRDEVREERRRRTETFLLRLAISLICVILATPPTLAYILVITVLIAHALHLDHLFVGWVFNSNQFQFAMSGLMLSVALIIWFVPINEPRHPRRRR